MPRAFSAMTSLRPHVNPAEFKLRTARRIADFFRLIVEPARPLWRDPEQVGSRRGLLSAFGLLAKTYLRDGLKFLIARTFFIMRRRWALSAEDKVGFEDVFFFMLITHILSDVVGQLYFS